MGTALNDLWWSKYLVLCMHSAISNLRCYIIIIYKMWGEREKSLGWESLTTPSWLIYSFPTLPSWHPNPVLLPGKSHGRRSLVGCSPWGRKESDTTEPLHFHFSLSCIGEGNGNPLQCSCLEIPRDRGAWWAAIYGVTQSQTRLKWLSSSSSTLPYVSVH